VVDDRRVLTGAHVVLTEGKRWDSLWVAFPRHRERTEAMKQTKEEPLRANPVNQQTWDSDAGGAGSARRAG
jgi:hypothetical protein